jgi:hypothetical protein
MLIVRGLTKKAEPPPTRDVSRDSGTDSANGGWLRRLVRRRLVYCHHVNLDGLFDGDIPKGDKTKASKKQDRIRQSKYKASQYAKLLENTS